jgi:hypothetical protein
LCALSASKKDESTTYDGTIAFLSALAMFEVRLCIDAAHLRSSKPKFALRQRADVCQSGRWRKA